MDSESYEAPALVVIGKIAELTEGSSTGQADNADGQGSTLPVSDLRLKRDIQAL